MTDLTRRNPYQPEGPTQAFKMAQFLSDSSMVPRGTKVADVLLLMMEAYDRGLSVPFVLRNFDFYDGSWNPRAQALHAMALAHPRCMYFRLIESTDEVATYETRREGDEDPTRISFTIAQAKAANLLGKKNWKHYPAAMLRARASAALARAVYPDAVGGLYTPEEKGSGLDTSAPPVDGEVVIEHVEELESEPEHTPSVPAVDAAPHYGGDGLDIFGGTIAKILRTLRYKTRGAAVHAIVRPGRQAEVIRQRLNNEGSWRALQRFCMLAKGDVGAHEACEAWIADGVSPQTLTAHLMRAWAVRHDTTLEHAREHFRPCESSAEIIEAFNGETDEQVGV
jgi:hypothetical protein